MALTYATTADLETYTGQPTTLTPEQAGRYLALASALVRRATRAAAYDTDATGAPTDPDVADAFRDAVCAQVAYWEGHDVDPTMGRAGVKGPVISSSILSGSVTRALPSGAADDQAASVDQLVPEAWLYLEDLDYTVTVWG